MSTKKRSTLAFMISWILVTIVSFMPSVRALALVLGRDSQVDFSGLSDEHLNTVGRATAFLTDAALKEGDQWQLNIALEARYHPPFCAGESVFNQPRVIEGLEHCSGIWVGKDLLLTAAHCVASVYEDQVSLDLPCEGLKVVFGFTKARVGRKKATSVGFRAFEVYTCKKVLYLNHTGYPKMGYDIALLKLDREVVGITQPLVSPTIKPLQANQPLALFGYPKSLPEKVDPGAFVTDGSGENSFLLSGNIMGGSSGGPVVDVKSGNVVGLVTGVQWIGPDESNQRDYLTRYTTSARGEECIVNPRYEFNFEKGPRVIATRIPKEIYRFF